MGAPSDLSAPAPPSGSWKVGAFPFDLHAAELRLVDLMQPPTVGGGIVKARLVVGVQHGLDGGWRSLPQGLGREGRPLDPEPLQGPVGGFDSVGDGKEDSGRRRWRGQGLGLCLGPAVHGRTPILADAGLLLEIPEVLECVCGDGREGAHVLPKRPEVPDHALDPGGLGGAGWRREEDGIPGEGFWEPGVQAAGARLVGGFQGFLGLGSGHLVGFLRMGDQGMR